MNEKNTPVVAFIGLGSMGLGMAKNLLKHGHKVIGVDPSAAARDAFSKAGGATESTPSAASKLADVVVVAVVNAQQVETVLYGDNGAVAALRAGGVVMQCATVPPAYAKALGERLAASGHVLLDAPMSGGRARAESGELTYMTSGNESAYAGAESILAATSAKVFRLGEAPGIGSLVKTVNQLLAGVHIAAAAEAMALAAKAGADTRAVYEVISASAGNSWMFGNRVPHMLDDDYSPLSAVEIFVKDLGLVLNTGHEHRLPLPLAAAALALTFFAKSAAVWSLARAASPFQWLTPGVTGGTLVGIAILALLIWLPTAWRSALAIGCLLAGVALVNITPENPYQNTPAFLFASQQTHLSSFSNIVRVLSQLWPFATIALLCVLGRHARPPLLTENAA